MSARQPACELEIAYGDHRSMLVRFLASKLDSRHCAEDVAQDLYLALPRLRPAEPIRNPRHFLLRVASNLALNLNDKEARRARLRSEQAAVLWTAVDDITPERALLATEALAIVDAAIAQLPDRTRQVLAWRRLDGLTNVEIASRLNISTTAVEKHLRKAMTHLVHSLAAYQG